MREVWQKWNYHAKQLLTKFWKIVLLEDEKWSVTKTNYSMLDDGQEHGRGLPPAIPPPDWISNVTCYSPILLEDHSALDKATLTTWTVIKAMLIIVSTFLSIALNFIFLVKKLNLL